MERDDLPTPSRQTPASGGPLKQPEPPDTEATEVDHDEGSGPFGVDMQRVKGGTRQADPQHEASAYGTGTDSTTGASLSPADPRSSFAPERTGASAPAQPGKQGDSGTEASTSEASTTEDAASSPAAGEQPEIRWDR